MIVASLDSGIERTGYAFFQAQNSTFKLVDYGCILTKKTDTLTRRLKKLFDTLDKLLTHHKPDIVVIEELFFNINKKTAITVAQAQGAALSAIARHDIPVEFLNPSEIKQLITGYGRADKKSIEKMIELTLQIKLGSQLDDVFDAVATGLAYCTVSKFKLLTQTTI